MCLERGTTGAPVAPPLETRYGAGPVPRVTWVVRFPSLAPSFRWRTIGTVAFAGVIQVVPVWNGSYVGLYASVFLVLVPVLTLAWLCAAWLLQSLCDLGAMR